MTISDELMSSGHRRRHAVRRRGRGSTQRRGMASPGRGLSVVSSAVWDDGLIGRSCSMSPATSASASRISTTSCLRADNDAAKLKGAWRGCEVLPIGEAFAGHLRRHPQMARGWLPAPAGPLPVRSGPYAQSWKRVVLRGGFEPADQYLALDGVQGLEWSYDDINAIVRYDDLGQPLLKSKWDARDRREPAGDEHADGRATACRGPSNRWRHNWRRRPISARESLLGSLAAEHDGVAWMRNVLWRKNAWFLVADEIRAPDQRRHFLAQTWLSWHPSRFTERRQRPRPAT